MVLVLASSSKRRRDLMEKLEHPFIQVEPDVKEANAGLPEVIAMENAIAKASWARNKHPKDIIVGADTLISFKGRVCGKPRSKAEERTTLNDFSGRVHGVVTGYCIISDVDSIAEVERSEVTFKVLSDEMIEEYVSSGEWKGKAGGYAIQGRGRKLVSDVRGSYTNVVGLPLEALSKHLNKLGLDVCTGGFPQFEK